jgi:hypothetical protein
MSQIWKRVGSRDPAAVVDDLDWGFPAACQQSPTMLVTVQAVRVGNSVAGRS